MLKIGLTGGIGSGKTLVASMFSFLGIPVYNADKRAKELVNLHIDLQLKIIGLLGQNAFEKDGKYDTRFVARKVFEDKHLLEHLNALIHPYVKEDSSQWMSTKKNHPYVIKEAALLFESGSHEELDYIIFVSAPKHLRIKRVINRDSVMRKDVLKRMENQFPEKYKRQHADFVIMNNERVHIIPQIFKINEKLVELSKTKSDLR